ncbi:MAG: hypothetical protein ACRDYF_06555 [Acidimicrobiia bacterium]
MPNIILLVPVAGIFLAAWLYPVVQAIRVPSEAWAEVGQVKGLWVALTFWFPVFFGLIFLLAVHPRLVIAWREVYSRAPADA